MGFTSVLLLLLIGVATGYAQTKCCFPDQFEIAVGQEVGFSESGRGSATFANSYMAFDYTNRRTGAFVNFTRDGKFTFHHIITNYKTLVQYDVQPITQTCNKLSLPASPMMHCVPANAAYINTVYLGNRQLTVDNFNATLHIGQASLSVTKGDCLPNSEIITGKGPGMDFLSISGYYNYVSGIKDPSKYFAVPSYCPKSFSTEPRANDFLPFKVLL